VALEFEKEKLPLWVRVLKHFHLVVLTYDEDFGEEMKVGIKFKIPWG